MSLVKCNMYNLRKKGVVSNIMEFIPVLYETKNKQ